MGATILTTDDLRDFKLELLEEIKQLLQKQQASNRPKWLRSPEVKKLLGISHSTLQNFRDNGIIPHTRIGGVLYYDYQEILEILEKNRVQTNSDFNVG